MLLGTCAAIAANLLFMESTTYSMLLLARFLQGIASSCVWTMCLCLIADNWPREHLGKSVYAGIMLLFLKTKQKKIIFT
jgi:predicted MFS family arabinose efflux permease